MSGKRKRTATIESSERRNSMKNIMQQAMQHDVAWDYEENRRKIHEILDIVLDTNTMEARTSDRTGTLPTVRFQFSGIGAKLVVELFPDGWHGGMDSEDFEFNTDEEISQKAIDAMRRECESALEGKAGVEAAQQRVKQLEREIRERTQEMERLGLYIEEQQSGTAGGGQEDLEELEIEEDDK